MSTKRSLGARLAATAAAGVAVYEMIAVLTDAMPTVTQLIESLPELVELAIIGGLSGWLFWHFKWFARLMDLIRREERRS